MITETKINSLKEKINDGNPKKNNAFAGVGKPWKWTELSRTLNFDNLYIELIIIINGKNFKYVGYSFSEIKSIRRNVGTIAKEIKSEKESNWDPIFDLIFKIFAKNPSK